VLDKPKTDNQFNPSEYKILEILMALCACCSSKTNQTYIYCDQTITKDPRLKQLDIKNRKTYFALGKFIA